MFTDLAEEDRQAFFDLLDEYFSARPHLLAGGSGAGEANVQAAAGTLLNAAARDPGVRSAAMGAARGAVMGGRPPPPAAGSKGPPPAPPANKLGGLVSGKSFGSMSTASKGAAFASMIGRKPAAVAATPAPAAPASRSSAPLPPPARRGSGGPTSPPPPPPAYRTSTPVRQNVGEAVALYEYPGTDADDLHVSEGERVLLLEKVSDDWWKAASMDGAREGLVPSAYVQVQT